MTISRERFEEIQIEHGDHSSWAVWGDPDGSTPIGKDNLHFPQEVTSSLLSVLRTDVVTVALNRGNKGTDVAPWETFHTSANSNDHVLAEALRGTPAWGAFMTDLDSETVESESGNVHVTDDHVKDLIDRVRNVAGKEAPFLPTFILFGTKVKDAFSYYEKISGVRLNTITLLHYSKLGLIHALKRYREILGQPPSGLSQEQAYIGYVQKTLLESKIL